MEILPWIQAIDIGYNASSFLQLENYKHFKRWRIILEKRKAGQRGMRVNGIRSNAIVARHSKEEFAPEGY